MEVSSDPGFGEFHKGVAVGLCAPCRNLWGTEHKNSRGCKTQKEAILLDTIKTERPPTCLRWESESLIDSASSWGIPVILKALVSMMSSKARCEAGVPAQRGEQYSIELCMEAL